MVAFLRKGLNCLKAVEPLPDSLFLTTKTSGILNTHLNLIDLRGMTGWVDHGATWQFSSWKPWIVYPARFIN